MKKPVRDSQTEKLFALSDSLIIKSQKLMDTFCDQSKRVEELLRLSDQTIEQCRRDLKRLQ